MWWSQSLVQTYHQSILPRFQLNYGGRPYSSLALRDYDPLSDTYGMDQSRSYLGGRSLSGGATSSLDGHLRDTAISGLSTTVAPGGSDPYDDRTRFLASRRFVGNATRLSSQYCRALLRPPRGVDKRLTQALCWCYLLTTSLSLLGALLDPLSILRTYYCFFYS